MALAAAQVIDAIAGRINGLPLAGTDVFTSRAWPLTEEILPAWRVVAEDEEIEAMTVHRKTPQKHDLEVTLRGFARAVANLDDALNALAAEVLTAIFADVVVSDPLADPPVVADALDQLANKLQISARRIERGYGTDGEAALGAVTVTLKAVFKTMSNAPETII